MGACYKHGVIFSYKWLSWRSYFGSLTLLECYFFQDFLLVSHSYNWAGYRISLSVLFILRERAVAEETIKEDLCSLVRWK